MAGIFDFLTGNNTDNTNGDAVSSYLGNLVDPSTSQQYQDANRSRALLGLAVGLLGQGASRTPITFGQSLGAGLQGALSAQNSFSDQALKAAQTSNQVSEGGYKKLQGLASILDLQNKQKALGMLNGVGQQGEQAGQGQTDASGQTAPQSLTHGSIAPTTADALNMIAGPESAGNYFIGTGQKPGTQTLQGAQLDASGFPIWEGTGNSHAAGRYQIQPGTWKDTVNKYFNGNLDWRVPANQDAVAAKLYEDQGFGPWAPYNPVLRQQLQSRQALGLSAAPPSMGLPGQSSQGAAPQQGNAAQGQAPQGVYGGLPMSPQRAQQIANAFAMAGGLTVPDYIKAAAGLPVDFAKTTQAKQVELNAAGPMVTAQEQARRPFGTTSTTVQNPDGTLREGPIPNTIFDAIAAQSFPGLKGAPSPGPTPVTGSNFATNLPRLPGQPGMAAPTQLAPPQQAPMAPPQMQPAQAPQGNASQGNASQAGSMAPGFDPNIWAAQNKTPIGLVGGNQLLPIDKSGNPIPNAPGWGVPNVRPQIAPPPALPAPQNAPQGQGMPSPATPAPQMAPMAPQAPQGGYQLGKPILNPSAEFNPQGYDFSPKIGNGPGQNQPLPVPASADHPYTTEIPPLSSQAPLRFSGTMAPEVQKGWVTTSQKLADAQQGIQSSKQLLNTMAGIFKNYESGSFATYQSDLMAKLNALGISTPNGMNSPADMQQLLKDNFQVALQTMKATGIGRFTQMELKMAGQNFANPDLKPAANFAIMTQDFGKIMQAEALAKDWATANQNGWSDPNSFAQKWYGSSANDLQTFVNRAKVQFGPFKGMNAQETQQMIPQTATGPNGQQLMLQNGKWIGM